MRKADQRTSAAAVVQINKIYVSNDVAGYENTTQEKLDAGSN